MLYSIHDQPLKVEINIRIDNSGHTHIVETPDHEKWTVKMRHGKMKYIEAGVKKLALGDVLLVTGALTLCFVKVVKITKNRHCICVHGSEVVHKEVLLKRLQRQVKKVHYSKEWKSPEENEGLVLELPLSLINGFDHTHKILTVC